MSDLVDAELIKLRSTRLLWGIVGTTIVISLLSTAIPILSGSLDEKTGRSLFESQRNLLANGAAAGLFMFILGLSGVTSEFRFGTVTPTFLAVPDRRQVMVAKAIAYGTVAVLLTASTIAVCAAVGLPLMVSTDLDIVVEIHDVIALTVGGIASALLMTLIAVGLGAAVRSTVAVLVGMVALLVVVLPLLNSVSDTAGQYLPLDTAARVAGVAAEGPSQFLSGLILAGYAALALAVGLLLLERRDVT